MTIDILLIGWPRSGTSSLFDWLTAHPDVEGSEPKETFFFMDRGHPLFARNGASLHDDGPGGVERFFHDGDRKRRRLEATTHTFYQRAALDHFGRLPEKPTTIALLRRPGDRIRSSFRYTQESLAAIDDRLTFPMYVDHLLEGHPEVMEPRYHSTASYWIAALELELTRYVDWLEKWADAVGEANLVILLFEELARDPRSTLIDLALSIGLDPEAYAGFEPQARNATVRMRHPRLHRWTERARALLPHGKGEDWLRMAYRKVQVAPSETTMSDAERQARDRLDAWFTPYNEQLADRFGVDVGVWKQP